MGPDPTDPVPIGDYPHEEWCHWDMDCCGCTCVGMLDQLEWGWM